MTAGTYPVTTNLNGFARVRAWGSVQDATIFVVARVALVATYVRPKVTELTGNHIEDWMLLIVAAIAGGRRAGDLAPGVSTSGPGPLQDGREAWAAIRRGHPARLTRGAAAGTSTAGSFRVAMVVQPDARSRPHASTS